MRLLILAGWMLVSAHAADNQAVTPPPDVSKGATITASGAVGGSTQSVAGTPMVALTPITVTLKPLYGQSKTLEDTILPIGTTGFSFVIPQKAEFGMYQIAATQGGKDLVLNPPLTINVMAKAPQIDAVSPRVFFIPEPTGEVTVIGSGFTEDHSLYSLHFASAESPLHCADNQGAASPAEKAHGCYVTVVDNDHRQLTFGNMASLKNLPNDAGKQKFTVVVAGVDSNSLDITFSKAKPNEPRQWALFLLGILVLIIYLLLRSGKKNVEHAVDDKSYFLSALFLDKQTNTYSLSQCQFYAWTGAAVLGYIYLATAKSLIQNSLTFPDIPTGLPGILLASAGTGVLAAGITSSKGGKGAGDVHPSLSDFITTGGVVAAERLQFVVWTIVGVVTFVRLVFLSDPATVDDLPKIPDNFLQLMAISSAGYLGGKLARKAGPTLSAVSATLTTDGLALTLTGSGLSQAATFSIAGKLVPPGNIAGKDKDSKDIKLPEIVQPDPTNSEQGFARVLKFTISTPDPAWLGKDIPLTITNLDGQKAVWNYNTIGIDSATLDSAKGTLTIQGGPFDATTTVAWAPGKGAAATPIGLNITADTITGSVTGVNKGDPVTVTVTNAAGDTATLTITVT
jgi:hypothetical protein